MNTKDHVLELLEQHRGESISGGYIAERLQLSRNAVWKAIGGLRKDGYNIIAATNKGYLLSDENDILSVQGIKPFLSERSLPYVDHIRIYNSLESTNKTAKEMAVAGAAHGTVIIADCQSAGKGRYARLFFSPSGGLYMSLILDPASLRFEHITSVTAFAAVSVCESIEAISEKVPMIKWVNDIFIDGKKVCGILTEAVSDFESGSLGWIVLGIGINVNTPAEDFPRELRDAATSIYPDAKSAGIRNRLSAEIINRILGFEVCPDEAELFKKYKNRLMMLGKDITVTQGKTAYKARAKDIDSAGHLIVEREGGEILTLSAGEIHIQ